MRRSEIEKMSPLMQLSYGFKGFDRPIFLAPANRDVFFFMCRANYISRARALRLWSLYCLVRDGDSIGPDRMSCDIVRATVNEFKNSSDKHIGKALKELADLGMLYECTTTRALPTRAR